MAINGWIHNTLQWAGTKNIESAANFLKVTGAIGWALSCLGQVGAILINKEIPAKEKKFLVPQEMLDGAIVVTLFWFLTSKFKTWGEKLVNKGKILPDLFTSNFADCLGKLGNDKFMDKFFQL